MKRRLHGAPLERIEPISEVAALELRIEEAWVRLVSVRRRRSVTLYLTDRNLIHGIEYEARKAGTEIGTYDHRVTLPAFREDVFHVYEQQRRAA